MIAIILGVSIITPMFKMAEEATESEAASDPVISGMLSVLPIVFVAVMIIGTIAYMGYMGTDSSPKTIKNSKGLKKQLLEMSSQFNEYVRNLDSFLGIETVMNYDMVDPLRLEGNKLSISDDFHWFIVDKHEKYDMLRIVGLNKENALMNVSYILGRNENPYLIVVPNKYYSQEDSVLHSVMEYTPVIMKSS